MLAKPIATSACEPLRTATIPAVLQRDARQDSRWPSRRKRSDNRCRVNEFGDFGAGNQVLKGTILPVRRCGRVPGGSRVADLGASMAKTAGSRAESSVPVSSLTLERLVRSPADLVENLPIGI